MPNSHARFSVAQLARAILSCAIAAAAFPTQSQAETIYSGMTTAELAAFAKDEGWSVQVDPGKFRAVTIHLEGQSIRIEMFDCDEQERCKEGIIQDQTYYMLKPDRYGFWHWNLERRGATGFGPSYITLQRYLHFNGVTNRYLREVIGEIWPKAARSFWDEVKQRYESEWQPAKPEEEK